jgi:hypothetical protein
MRGSAPPPRLSSPGQTPRLFGGLGLTKKVCRKSPTAALGPVLWRSRLCLTRANSDYQRQQSWGVSAASPRYHYWRQGSVPGFCRTEIAGRPPLWLGVDAGTCRGSAFLSQRCASSAEMRSPASSSAGRMSSAKLQKTSRGRADRTRRLTAPRGRCVRRATWRANFLWDRLLQAANRAPGHRPPHNPEDPAPATPHRRGACGRRRAASLHR